MLHCSIFWRPKPPGPTKKWAFFLRKIGPMALFFNHEMYYDKKRRKHTEVFIGRIYEDT